MIKKKYKKQTLNLHTNFNNNSTLLNTKKKNSSRDHKPNHTVHTIDPKLHEVKLTKHNKKYPTTARGNKSTKRNLTLEKTKTIQREIKQKILSKIPSKQNQIEKSFEQNYINYPSERNCCKTFAPDFSQEFQRIYPFEIKMDVSVGCKKKNQKQQKFFNRQKQKHLIKNLASNIDKINSQKGSKMNFPLYKQMKDNNSSNSRSISMSKRPSWCQGQKSAKQVLQYYSHFLTSLQKSQLKKHYAHQKIYYIGHKAKKQKKSGSKNHNYDDSKGRYAWNIHDHINYQYQIISQLGKGSFGDVLKVYDHKKNCMLALKIIKNQQSLKLQAKVQIEILAYIKQRCHRERNQNIIQVKDYFVFREHVVPVHRFLIAIRQSL